VRALPPVTAGKVMVKTALPPSVTALPAAAVTKCATAAFSSMPTVTCVPVPSDTPPLTPASPVGAEMVKVNVSSSSAKPSLAAVRVTVPWLLAAPAAMLSVPVTVVTPAATVGVTPLAVRSGIATVLALAPLLLCVPITAVQVTPTAPADSPLKVTVNSTSVPSSTSPAPAGLVRATVTVSASLSVIATLAVLPPLA